MSRETRPHDSSIAKGFDHPVNGPRCARWTSYRRWRLCLRSEAIPTNFRVVVLNGPYGRLPKPGINHFQAIHNQYVVLKMKARP
jgi:hypothetical protein